MGAAALSPCRMLRKPSAVSQLRVATYDHEACYQYSIQIQTNLEDNAVNGNSRSSYRWEFEFPVWVMVNTARFLEIGLDAYCGITDDDLGWVFAFFTDEDLSQQYIDEKGSAHLRPHPVEELADLLELVEVAGDGGITKLAVDPTERANRKSRVYELSE